MSADDLVRHGYLKPDGVVNVYRMALDIKHSIEEMDDEEIADVMKSIGLDAPDSMGDCIGFIGIQTMLFLTLTTFPEFYERHGLSHVN